MNRRSFIKKAAMSLIGGSLIFQQNSCRRRKERPRWTFLHISDTHLQEGIPAYALVREKVDAFIDAVNSEQDFPLPDFVLHTGDMIHGEKLERLLPECLFAKQTLDRLACPWHPVVGNHEVIQREGHPQYQAAYEQVFGADRVNYAFERSGLVFILLNSSSGLASPTVNIDRIERPDKADIIDHLNRHGGDWLPAAIEKRNSWLQEVLRDTASAQKIVACHIPLISIREEEVLRQSFGFFSYKMLGDELVALLEAQQNLKAVLSGHLHLSGAVQQNRITHVVTSGFASYPCHFSRWAVYADSIEVDFYQLAPHLVTPETNIHGARRHGKNFTDDLHPTAEEYVAGNSDENHRQILLN